MIETHDLDHPEACGLVNVSSDSYPIRTVTIGKYYFIIKLKLENKFFNLICITYTFSAGVVSGSFLRYRMQVTERRNFMDIFYINCFSHSLYLSRARNISCFSCFLTIVYAIYMPKLNTSGGVGGRQNKNAG